MIEVDIEHSSDCTSGQPGVLGQPKKLGHLPRARNRQNSSSSFKSLYCANWTTCHICQISISRKLIICFISLNTLFKRRGIKPSPPCFRVACLYRARMSNRLRVQAAVSEFLHAWTCGGKASLHLDTSVGVGDASLRMHRLHDVLQFFETSLKNCIVKN